MSFQIYIPDRILFEDDYILVLNKPAGLMVEPDRNNHPNLLQQVKKYLKSFSNDPEVYAQHLHRLDRPVSGVILFAKQRAVLKDLSEQFAQRSVRKYYLALTLNEPIQKKGTIEHWHRKEKKKAALYDAEIEFTEKARLDYSVEDFGEKFRWHIELHTGKYHQIRSQLAYVGCPILGDSLYGSTVSYKPDAIALHASTLIFSHPISHKEMVMQADNDFA